MNSTYNFYYSLFNIVDEIFYNDNDISHDEWMSICEVTNVFFKQYEKTNLSPHWLRPWETAT